jgi:hypothetical protein
MEAKIVANKDVVLQVMRRESYVYIHAEWRRKLQRKIANKFFENVADSKYFVMTLTNNHSWRNKFGNTLLSSGSEYFVFPYVV